MFAETYVLNNLGAILGVLSETSELRTLSVCADILSFNAGIQFGTAGLRGRMRAGFSFMNSLTVIQASQGLAKFIKQGHKGPGEPSVVIGCDARHNSHDFAILATRAFEEQGIYVWWYGMPLPTPFVPFAILKKRATAGVMITASHVSCSGYRAEGASY
jgi:phosphoglucomutase